MKTAATAEKWFGFGSGHLADPELQWPEKTARMWNEHLRGRIGRTADEFSRINRGTQFAVTTYNIHVFLPDDFPISGHLFYIRKLRDNMSVFNYCHCRERKPRAELSKYCGAGYVSVRSKYVLRKLAEVSPLFAPIWEDLKEVDPDAQGIYLADAPAAEWLDSIQPDEQRLYDAFRDGLGAAIAGMETATASKEAMACLVAFERKQDGEPFEFVKAAFEAMVAHAPWFWEFWESYVLYLLRQDMPDWACDVIAVAQRQYPECRMIDRLGILCGLERKDWGRAERHIKRYLEVNPWDDFAMMAYARVAYAKKDYALAADLFKECMEHGRLSSKDMMDCGEALFYARRQKESLDMFESMASHCDPHPLIFNNIGMTMASMGQYPEAVKYCRRALDLDSTFRFAWDSLGFAYLKGGQHADAIPALLKAIELEPNYPDAWRHLLHAYYKNGDADHLESAKAYVGRVLPEELARFEREKGKNIPD
ncbi:MAG: tetratricopeptide repeat protein [Lentisphaerae bacterium]|nr:tetratricopeptide repeat protein [Lentisphaerota bacterium]